MSVRCPLRVIFSCARNARYVAYTQSTAKPTGHLRALVNEGRDREVMQQRHDDTWKNISISGTLNPRNILLPSHHKCGQRLAIHVAIYGGRHQQMVLSLNHQPATNHRQ